MKYEECVSAGKPNSTNSASIQTTSSSMNIISSTTANKSGAYFMTAKVETIIMAFTIHLLV